MRANARSRLKLFLASLERLLSAADQDDLNAPTDDDFINKYWNIDDDVLRAIRDRNIRETGMGSHKLSQQDILRDEEWLREFEKFPGFEREPPHEFLSLVFEARSALTDNDIDELISCLEPLTEFTLEHDLTTSDEVEQLLAWASALDRNRLELIYAPRLIPADEPSILVATHSELIKTFSKQPNLLYSITPRQFEEVIAEIFGSFGYQIELTAQTQDHGCDIIAVTRSHGIALSLLIECKRYRPEHKVGIAYVQRLLGVKIAERANKALLVTTSSFSKPANDFASQHFWDLELKDHHAVIEWANRYARSNA
jgi:hypothetical protein